MKQSEQINELVSALIKAQPEFKSLKCDAENPFFNSKYATLNSVIDSTKDALIKNGLVVIQTTDGPNLVTMLAHTSGQWVSGSYPLTPDKQTPQGMGSAFTYARRYNHTAITGQAPSDEDDDGNSTNVKQAPKKKPVDDWVKRLEEFEITLPHHVQSHMIPLSAKERAEYYKKYNKDIDKIVDAVDGEIADKDVPAIDGILNPEVK